MSSDPKDTAEAVWYRGKVTRRRLIGYGASAGALGAAMLVPAPWRAAFGQAKPYKIGSLQPLSGAAASGGKTALVGVQMAVDRINGSGGINGRPVELIVADDESKPDVGAPQDREAGGGRQRRCAPWRLPVQHLPRLHAGV
jgi:branched-chain amino acid transport system substrate-binding protein